MGRYTITENNGRQTAKHNKMVPKGMLSRPPKFNMKGGQMTYEKALEVIKVGGLVKRRGRKELLSFTEGRTITTDEIWTDNMKEIARRNRGQVTIQSYIVKANAEGFLELGWKPNAEDEQATDWELA